MSHRCTGKDKDYKTDGFEEAPKPDAGKWVVAHITHNAHQRIHHDGGEECDEGMKDVEPRVLTTRKPLTQRGDGGAPEVVTSSEGIVRHKVVRVARGRLWRNKPVRRRNKVRLRGARDSDSRPWDVVDWRSND